VIGLDTNVLARYFVEEADADSATEAQRQAARQLIESGQELFLPKTVALLPGASVAVRKDDAPAAAGGGANSPMNRRLLKPTGAAHRRSGCSSSVVAERRSTSR